MGDGLPLVGVIGAGTMGAGIAQVAAVAGHRVLLADAVDGAAGRAVDRAMAAGLEQPDLLATLDELESWYRDGHYRPSPLLRRAVLTNGPLS